MSEPDKCSAGTTIAQRLIDRADAHDRMSCGNGAQCLGFYSGFDAQLMRDAAEALRGVAQARPDREAIARVLYECEKRRATNADAVVRSVAPNASKVLLMEPWDDCKDTFLSDADAVLALPSTYSKSLTESESK